MSYALFRVFMKKCTKVRLGLTQRGGNSSVNDLGSCDWMMIQSCHGQAFLVHLQKRVFVGETKLFGRVQLLGPREIARKFIYTLELKRRHRTLSYSSRPRCVRDNPVPGDHLELNWKMTKFFETQGVVAITVSIDKK